MSIKRFTVATIALFSSSEQTHCALVVCDTEWATVALHSTFWLCTEVVIRTWLFSCYMADVTWNWCRLGARSVYAILTCACLQCHFIWSHIRRMHVGRTSLSLALGNMVVARQILLIFNLSYLPCSVQFVNKNYCHSKNDLFTTCWCHYVVREWCIVSLEEVLMKTPSGRKPSVVLTSKVRWARSENGCVRKTLANFYKKNVQTWSYTFLKEEFP